MKYLLFLSVGILFALTSCSDPIKTGTNVTVRNTLQTAADPSQGGTSGVETPVEVILGVPDGTFILSAEIGDGIEFDNYLSGLYDIDLSAEAITFTLVAAADDPIYSNFFRTIEPGTFDRYYFTFDDNHKIESGSSSNGSVALNIVSDSEVMVQISEGFDFNPGTTFTINLEK